MTAILLPAILLFAASCSDNAPSVADNRDPGGIPVDAAPIEGTTVIDHRAVQDFDAGVIPAFWIEEVKRQGILIHIPGRSHAQQIVGDLDGSPVSHVGGLETLASMDPTYAVEIRCELADLPASGALRILKGQYDPNTGAPIPSWECRYDYQTYWSSEDGRDITEFTANRAAELGDPIDASIYGWSFDIIQPQAVTDENGNPVTFDAERRATYLNAIVRFGNGLSAVKAGMGTEFVYATAPTDADYAGNEGYLNVDGYRSTIFNQDIRTFAAANSAYLFDQADIENWSEDFSKRRTDTYNGLDLQLRHEDWDGNDCSHGGMNLCVAKAKAIWWLAARLAGWDGTPE